MLFDINKIEGSEPLLDYPWRSEIDKLLEWLKNKDPYIKAFCFDVVMSAAYIDATSGIEKSIERCDGIVEKYNSHIGFINLCSPCYINNSIWAYQKAVKPQSGALGKLSSEVILRFIEKLSPELIEVLVIGGTECADAALKHKNGTIILAEVKSAPLLTYPFLFNIPKTCLKNNHENVVITNSQLKNCNSAIYLHHGGIIDLGEVGASMWPFRPLVNFITNEKNSEFISVCIDDWVSAREAYSTKNRQNKMYYLANASGHPPLVAKERDGWPKKESISDGKTSAGMDRTDDIKKGIYQSLKIGTNIKNLQNFSNIKTAIISNLPAYRHGEDYISPFLSMLWGMESDLENLNGEVVLKNNNLKRVFDFIITLEGPVLRGEKL